MIIDDDRPRPASNTNTIGADLARLSVPELQERVTALQAEITRTQTEIDKKQAQIGAAEALFKK